MDLSTVVIRWLIAGIFSGMAMLGHAFDTNYVLEIEGRGFSQATTENGKYTSDIAASFEVELRTSLNQGNTVATFTPFSRWDSRDPKRRHSDIRELNLIHSAGSMEYQVGIGKVFWGVAESSHLVDIINQTDLLEGIDGEDKLGQPMIKVSRLLDQLTLDAFVLPGFREREFLSPDNPLALPFEVDDNEQYESDDGRDHVDYALRLSGYKGVVDYGLSWFKGTSREPDFLPSGTPGRLIPFYPQIDQFGLDLQITKEAWLWKLEAIHRKTVRDGYNAAVGGLEYSFYGMNDGQYDLGLLAEYHYDDRENPATVIFQNDVFVGMRFGFTDAESSEILAGAIFDQDDQTASYRIEAARRIFTNAKISIEAQVFSNADPNNFSFGFRDSDFVQASLELFF